MNCSSGKPTKERGIIDILKDSIDDKSTGGHGRPVEEVRYKMIIDSSEDESVSRMLLMFGILDEKHTQTFMCSSFPQDREVQKVRLVGINNTSFCSFIQFVN